MRTSFLLIALMIGWTSVAFSQGEFILSPTGINTTNDDIICGMWDGKLLHCTNDQQDLVSDFKWNTNKVFFLSTAERGETFAALKQPEALFAARTQKDEGTATYNPGDSTLYFSTANNYGQTSGDRIKIYACKWDGAHWSEPFVLPFCKSNFDYAHPSYDATLNLLVFSSNASGGIGKMDIWYSYKIPGGWTNPVNAGFPVNSPGIEIFPSIFDGDIYYASNGIIPNNGFDLFCAQKKFQWANSFQLAEPFNSAGDDIMICWLNEDKGFLSTNRAGGKGGDDIYLFERKRDPEKINHFTARLDYLETPLPGATVLVTNSLGEVIMHYTTDSTAIASLEPLNTHEVYRMNVSGISPGMYPDCTLKIIDEQGNVVKVLRLNANGWAMLELLPFDYTDLHLLPNPDESILSISLEGQVYKQVPGDMGKGEPITILDDNNLPVAVVYTTDAGKFSVWNLFPELQYTFKLGPKSSAKQVMLLDHGKKITLPVLKAEAVFQRLNKDEAIELINELNEKIYVSPNDCFIINRVYYESNSTQLTSEAKSQLDQLIIILQKNPDLKLKLTSHTDSKGSAESNVVLSEKRAESVIQYLVVKGISRGRMTSKGMGEAELLNDCGDSSNCSEQEHAINRRTEINLLR